MEVCRGAFVLQRNTLADAHNVRDLFGFEPALFGFSSCPPFKAIAAGDY
jgi:hypothetical protein